MKHDCVHEERYEDQNCLFRSVVVNGTTRNMAVHNLQWHPEAPKWARMTGEIELNGKIFEVSGQDSLMMYKGAEISPSPSGWTDF